MLFEFREKASRAIIYYDYIQFTLHRYCTFQNYWNVKCLSMLTEYIYLYYMFSIMTYIFYRYFGNSILLDMKSWQNFQSIWNINIFKFYWFWKSMVILITFSIINYNEIELFYWYRLNKVLFYNSVRSDYTVEIVYDKFNPETDQIVNKKWTKSASVSRILTIRLLGFKRSDRDLILKFWQSADAHQNRSINGIVNNLNWLDRNNMANSIIILHRWSEL